MSNLKFTLFVTDHLLTGVYGEMYHARVFDLKSLQLVHRAIQSGVFGHHSKRRFALVPFQMVRTLRFDGGLCKFSEDQLKEILWLYPQGGRVMDPDVFTYLIISTSSTSYRR